VSFWEKKQNPHVTAVSTKLNSTKQNPFRRRKRKGEEGQRKKGGGG